MSATEPSYLLDTSALLTLLEDEAGADRVERVLKQAPTLICAVSLVEVYYITLQDQSPTEADVRHAMLKRSGAEILWELEEPIIVTAARFKAQHTLSLADALIAASAHRHGAILLHKDPEYEALAGEVKQERLQYKPAGKRR